MAKKRTHQEREDFFAPLIESLSQKKPIIGVEVGVWKGDLSYYLLDRVPRLTMYMVDPFLAYPHFRASMGQAGWDDLYLRVVNKMSVFGDRAVLIRAKSVEAAQHMRKKRIDFVYIDAGHDYDNVRADLHAWEPLLRSGGIMSGHDYSMAPGAGGGGVIQAVDEFVAELGVKLIIPEKADTSWYWVKP